MGLIAEILIGFPARIQKPTLALLIGGMVLAACGSKLEIPEPVCRFIVFLLLMKVGLGAGISMQEADLLELAMPARLARRLAPGQSIGPCGHVHRSGHACRDPVDPAPDRAGRHDHRQVREGKDMRSANRPGISGVMSNVKIEAIVRDKATAEAIITAVAETCFTHCSGIAYVEPLEILRPHKFEP